MENPSWRAAHRTFTRPGDRPRRPPEIAQLVRPIVAPRAMTAPRTNRRTVSGSSVESLEPGCRRPMRRARHFSGVAARPVRAVGSRDRGCAPLVNPSPSAELLEPTRRRPRVRKRSASSPTSSNIRSQVVIDVEHVDAFFAFERFDALQPQDGLGSDVERGRPLARSPLRARREMSQAEDPIGLVTRGRIPPGSLSKTCAGDERGCSRCVNHRARRPTPSPERTFPNL